MVIGNLTALFSLDSSNFTEGLKKVEKQTQEVTNRIDSMNKEISSLTLKSGAKFLGWATAASVGVYQFNKRLATMIKHMQSLRRQLRFVTGSAEEAAKAFAFLDDVSKRLGVSLEAGITGFNKMAIAAKNSNLTMEQVKDIYEGVIEASAVLGLSTDQINRTFLAFEQMITSTVVRSQELNLQLSDALPGSLAIMAKALGVTTRQLRKMMEEGMLVSAEVLPQFIKVLRDQVAPGIAELDGTLVQALGNMESAWTKLKLAVADGVIEDAVKALTVTLTLTIKNMQAWLSVTNALWKQIKEMSVSGSLFLDIGSGSEAGANAAAEATRDVFSGVTDEIERFDEKFHKLIKDISEKGQAAAMKPLEALKFRLEKERADILGLLEGYRDEREKSLKKSLKDDERYGKALEALYEEYGEAVIKVMESFGVRLNVVNKKIADETDQTTRDSLEKQWGAHLNFVENTLSRLTDALSDWVTGTEVSWRDLLDDMGKQLTKFALQVLFLEPIMQAFRNAVLGPQPINAFAGGGIIREPVMGIGLRTGERYSLGEHGPEEVTPVGASAREVTVNISAVDSKSLVSLMRENPGAVTTPIVEALNAGDRGLTASLRGSL